MEHFQYEMDENDRDSDNMLIVPEIDFIELYSSTEPVARARIKCHLAYLYQFLDDESIDENVYQGFLRLHAFPFELLQLQLL